MSIDKNLSNFCKLPVNITLNRFAQPIRQKMVAEAIKFPKGPTQDDRIITPLYSSGHFLIALEKPGKEAADNYDRCIDKKTGRTTNNINDMLPVIILKGARREEKYTFTDMFEMIERLMRSDPDGLEILGMQFFRMAFCLDHIVEGGKARLDIDKEALKILQNKIGKIGDLPCDVFILFIEALALNEDVKYHTLNYNLEMKDDYGRVSTLLTLSNLVSVLLNRNSISNFAGNFARPPRGVAPLPKTKITDYYPLFTRGT